LTPPKGGGVSARSGRNDDAQEEAGHGRLLVVRFLDGTVKSKKFRFDVIPAKAGIY